MTIRTPLFVCTIVIFFTAALSLRCSVSEDCDDQNPLTADVCSPTSGRCLNFYPGNGPALTARQNEDSNIQVITKQQLIDETNANALSVEERRLILEAAALLAGEFNPHRFLHLNLLKFDPVREFNELAKRLGRLTTLEFHEVVTDIFQRMDDLHTVYIRPGALNIAAAVLGFQVKRFFDPVDPTDPDLKRPSARYVVSDVAPEISFSDDTFVRGVEILQWDDVPIIEAVREEGADGYGSNVAAQKARGVDDLALKQFAFTRIPEEDDIQVTFRNLDGDIRKINVPWIYLMEKVTEPEGEEPMTGLAAHRLTKSKRLTLHPDLDLVTTRIGRLPKISRVETNRKPIQVDPQFENNFAAEIITTQVGEVGRLVLFDFPITTVSLINEYARVLSQMPPSGLIIDIRGNNGGFASTVTALFELTSDVEVPDLPQSVRATKLLERFVFAEETDIADDPLSQIIFEFTFKPLRAAIRTALAVGEPFTGPFDVDISAAPERLARVYNGPLIVVSDGRTYSAGDIFASFTQDLEYAELVGVADATGAGGANVAAYSQLQFIFPNFLESLPGDVEFTTSFARFFRTGARAGEIVENFGVVPDIRYFVTLKDVLEQDSDLFNFLARRLGVSEDVPQSSPGVDEEQHVDQSPEPIVV